MKKFLAIFTALSIGVLISAACQTQDGETITVRVNEVTHSIFYAPFYVAIEEGFFAEEKINIELTNGGGADKSMTAILSNSADIGLMGPEAAMYVYLGEREDYPKVFGQLTKRDGSFLISRTPITNFDYSQLNNKEIIAGRKGGVPAMTLEHTLNGKGLFDGQNVSLNYDVQFNLTAAAFEGGTGDFCTLFEPTASEFEKAGKGYIVASIGSDSGEIPYTAFMALNSYISQNEETVKGFLRAVYKGLNFIRTAPNDAIVTSLSKQFPAISNESILTSVKSYLRIDAWVDNMAMEKQSFERLKNIMTAAGELDNDVKFEDLTINEFADEIFAKIADK